MYRLIKDLSLQDPRLGGETEDSDVGITFTLSPPDPSSFSAIIDPSICMEIPKTECRRLRKGATNLHSSVDSDKLLRHPICIVRELSLRPAPVLSRGRELQTHSLIKLTICLRPTKDGGSSGIRGPRAKKWLSLRTPFVWARWPINQVSGVSRGSSPSASRGRTFFTTWQGASSALGHNGTECAVKSSRGSSVALGHFIKTRPGREFLGDSRSIEGAKGEQRTLGRISAETAIRVSAEC